MSALERHFSAKQLGEVWGLSDTKVRRLLENEPGVLLPGEPPEDLEESSNGRTSPCEFRNLSPFGYTKECGTSSGYRPAVATFTPLLETTLKPFSGLGSAITSRTLRMWASSRPFTHGA